jgi:thymidylate kinase
MREILEKVFASINGAGIRYVILRNYDLLPDEIIGGDIDLLVSPHDTKALKSILEEMGFLVIPDIFPHAFALFYNVKTGSLVKLDIIDRLVFGKRISISFPGEYEELVLKRRIFSKSIYIPSPEDEMLLLFLHCLGDKGFIQPSYREKLQKLISFPLNTGYFECFLSSVFGQEVSQKVAGQIMEKRYIDVIKLRHRLIIYLIGKFNIRNFFVLLKILKQKFKRKILGRKGLRIALVGPDGSGKTTIAQKIKDRQIFNVKTVYMGQNNFMLPTRQLFLGILKRRGKSGIFENRELLSSEREGIFSVKGKSRNVIDLFRFFHDLMDLCLRYFFYNYLYCRKGFMVINDRYVYDMLVGEEKIQKIPLVRWMILSLFPSPDFLFCLDVPVEKMYARKNEHSLEILQKMKINYINLCASLKNSQVIRNDTDADETVNIIISYVWKEYFSNLGRC